MKKLLSILFFLALSTSCFAHESSHFAEMFSQILFPIAILGCLITFPLTFILTISKFDKKISRILYGSYVVGSFAFFGILRILYSSIHNHFELTCQTVAVGLYLSLISIAIYLFKLVRFKLQENKKK